MLVLLFRLLSFLPLPLLHIVGSGLGWLVYLSSKGYRKRFQENIERAQFKHELFSAILESGKSIAELPFIWCAKPARVLKKVTIENWASVQAALDGGKGVILLTPHLGCFELFGQVIATKTQLTAMYRPPRKAAIKTLIETVRSKNNLIMAPATLSGVRMLAKTLKKGEAVGILPDQVPLQGEGIWANHFGKPAYTITLPAKLHHMTGAPILVAYAERLSFGRGYILHFYPLDHALSADVEQASIDLNHAMELLIAKKPSQYFWSYNRYKVPQNTIAPIGATEENK